MIRNLPLEPNVQPMSKWNPPCDRRSTAMPNSLVPKWFADLAESASAQLYCRKRRELTLNMVNATGILLSLVGGKLHESDSRSPIHLERSQSHRDDVLVPFQFSNDCIFLLRLLVLAVLQNIVILTNIVSDSVVSPSNIDLSQVIIDAASVHGD